LALDGVAQVVVDSSGKLFDARTIARDPHARERGA
jgi:hypothetical protein